MNNFLKTLSILNEAPPPVDWDLNTFNSSFAKQLKYAKERANQIGSGSSRVAFVIDYKGRETVIKIAKNKKGLAQNEKEADYGLYRMYPDITIPLIDYDEEHEEPTWIHFEKADKLTAAGFRKAMGFSFDDFAKVLDKFRLEIQEPRRGRMFNYDPTYRIDQELVAKIQESELYSDVTDMCMNFDLKAGDFTRKANWGMYQGRPVIIDLGFDTRIEELYYKRKF